MLNQHALVSSLVRLFKVVNLTSQAEPIFRKAFALAGGFGSDRSCKPL